MGKLINPGGGAQSSFLPHEYVKNKSQVRANFVALLLFTMVMAGVIGAFVVNHQRWRKVRAEAEIISTQFAEEAAKIDELKKLEAQRADLLDRAEVVTALIDRVPRSVLMAEIVRGLPSGLTLSLVTMDGERAKPPAPKVDPKQAAKGKTKSIAGKTVAKDEKPEEETKKVLPPKFKYTLTIEGISDENEKIADYVSALKTSPLFSEVELPLITPTIIEKVEYRKFRVTMVLREQADAREVAGAEEVRIDPGAFGLTNVDPASIPDAENE